VAAKQPIDQLFILRFFGAIVVVTHHYAKHLLPESGLLAELVRDAGFILSFFFALSGYVIGYNYFELEKFSKRNFLIKRLARLLPLYLLAFITTLLSAMLLKDAFPKGITVLIQALCLHAWVPSEVLTINFPSWSVSVELFFYLIFPWLVVQLGKRSFASIVWIAVTLWLLSSTQHVMLEHYLYDPQAKWTSEFILYFPVWHLNSFVAGIAGAEIFKQLRSYNIPVWLPPITGILGAAILFWITGTDNFLRPHIHNGVLSPIIILMLVGFSLDRTWLAKLMSNKLLVYLGSLTYGIYILQHPVYLWMSYFLGVETFSVQDFVIYLLTLTLVSVAAYQWFEEPVRKWIVNRADKGIRTS
jgi:peptidoglycan/LPS O-acetylase OafA/YrhL